MSPQAANETTTNEHRDLDQLIKTSQREHTARLTLARSPLNVLNIAMLTEVNAYLETLIGRTDLCALVIDAEGKDFSAGVDIPEHRADTVESMLETFHHTFRLLHQLPMPTVCAIHGGCYGGAMELAIFCDITLAADELRIGVPEITLGVFPPLAVAHLAHIVGIKKAAELIYTGAAVDATEALRLGLVNHVYPAREFAAHVEQFLTRLTRLSAFSLRQVKAAFRRAVLSDFERALSESESVYLKGLMAGSDPSEGITAFGEKRKPVWKNQ